MAKRRFEKDLRGRHCQMTEAAEQVVHVLSKAGAQVSVCVIAQHGSIRTAQRHIKVREDGHSIALTVLSKLGKQGLRVYGLGAKRIEEVLRTLDGYTLKIGAPTESETSDEN